MIYQLDDRPPLTEALFAAFQHLLAIAVSIMTPALIICSALGVNPADTGYIVSMSLLISGIATYIQIRQVEPVGSGLLSIQGTSFAFIGVLIAAGRSQIAAGGSAGRRDFPNVWNCGGFGNKDNSIPEYRSAGFPVAGCVSGHRTGNKF